VARTIAGRPAGRGPGRRAMSRIVIIGAGVAGLAAAARLGAAGHAVTVLEAGEATGGKLAESRFDSPSGPFRFDTGPSLLTWPAVFAELFAATGAPLDEELSLRRLDPIAHYRFPDGTTLDYPAGGDARREQMAARLGRESARDWAALLRRSEAMWKASQMPFLRGERSAGAFLRAAPRWPRLPAIAPTRTLHELGLTYLRDPRLRMMLERYATYAGGAPRRTPAAYAVIAHLEATMGGWQIDGGLRALADALARRALACGATIELGARVAEIRAVGGRVDSVGLLDGRRIPADAVISTADASSTYNDLLRMGRGGPAARLRGARARRIGSSLARRPRSLAGYVMLLGVRGRTPGVAAHNVLFGARYDREFEAIFDQPARLPGDPTIYVSISSDPASAPPGHEAWFVLVNVPRHDAGGEPDALDWGSRALVATMGERTLSLLAARGMPVRERLVLTRSRSPLDLQNDAATPGGAIYGTAPHGALHALRPANRTPVRGLFLAGGTAHPGGGLPLAALSAAIVAERIGPA